jgi:hypothetical protein
MSKEENDVSRSAVNPWLGAGLVLVRFVSDSVALLRVNSALLGLFVASVVVHVK